MARVTLLVVLLASCAPYGGPACTNCVGPYDLGLTSHRAALGLPR